MKLKLHDLDEGLKLGTNILLRELGIENCEDGIPVYIEKSDSHIIVKYENGKGFIGYKEKIHYFRALGLFIENLRKNSTFEVVEEPKFVTNGVMIDASRNAVMNVESIKKMLRLMALIGLNMIMMYTEDTYVIEDEPYFGYMRGRYTFSELKECDDYADAFGIEMIPCIQTLGHLKEFLKWGEAAKYRDTSNVLLVGDSNTYRLIEKMIVSSSAPLRSKRIHICMDEAYDLGLGHYLKLHGYKNRFEILNNHLNKVIEIASRHGLKPMMWSDMYFSLGSKIGDYYDFDSVVPEDVVANIPQDVQLIYWDYYHNEEEAYRKLIVKHKELGRKPIFAGGVWTFSGLCVDYDKTFLATNAALNACKKEHIQEVITTAWLDDGAETNIFSGLLGFQLAAEHGYEEELGMEKLKQRFEFCTGISFESIRDLGYIDEIPGCVTNILDSYFPTNASKYLLWQDILLGLFDKHVEGLDLAEHFARLNEKISKNKEKDKRWKFLFEQPEKLCAVLKLKYNMGIRIKTAYDNKEHEVLKHIIELEIPELYKNIDELRIAHREQWFETNKAFGWEVLSIRYGGLLVSLDNVVKRVNDYLTGKIDKIEELEEERLFYSTPQDINKTKLIWCNQYARIVSAGSF